MKLQITKVEENKLSLSNPYHMFKFSIRSDLTRKYYERRIRNYFEFIEFSPDKDMEERCNSFANAMLNDSSWGLNKIIMFLQYQKERTEKGDITAATLINFVKVWVSSAILAESRSIFKRN